MKTPTILLLAFAGLTTNSPLPAANWPQWRGPEGASLALPGNYPTTFSSSENIFWKTNLPGVGSSTPAVWENRIFVTCGIDGEGE